MLYLHRVSLCCAGCFPHIYPTCPPIPCTWHPLRVTSLLLGNPELCTSYPLLHILLVLLHYSCPPLPVPRIPASTSFPHYPTSSSLFIVWFTSQILSSINYWSVIDTCQCRVLQFQLSIERSRKKEQLTVLLPIQVTVYGSSILCLYVAECVHIKAYIKQGWITIVIKTKSKRDWEWRVLVYETKRVGAAVGNLNGEWHLCFIQATKIYALFSIYVVITNTKANLSLHSFMRFHCKLWSSLSAPVFPRSKNLQRFNREAFRHLQNKNCQLLSDTIYKLLNHNFVMYISLTTLFDTQEMLRLTDMIVISLRFKYSYNTLLDDVSLT